MKDEAKEVLKYENMSREDQMSYRRHIENKRVEISVIQTAEFNAVRDYSIEIAKVFLKAGSNKDLIATATKLTLEEIDALERGEEIDKNTDDDDDEFYKKMAMRGR